MLIFLLIIVNKFPIQTLISIILRSARTDTDVLIDTFSLNFNLVRFGKALPKWVDMSLNQSINSVSHSISMDTTTTGRPCVCIAGADIRSSNTAHNPAHTLKKQPHIILTISILKTRNHVLKIDTITPLSVIYK